jgi:hypothetical protein
MRLHLTKKNLNIFFNCSYIKKGMTCVENNICIYNYMYIIYICISISKWICIYNIYMYIYTQVYKNSMCIQTEWEHYTLRPLNLTHVALAGVPMPRQPWPPAPRLLPFSLPPPASHKKIQKGLLDFGLFLLVFICPIQNF